MERPIIDMAPREFRRLHRKAAQLDRRVALATLSGKVAPGSQDPDTRTLRLEIGTSRDGRPILSPRVRWQAAGAGTFRVHSVPADHEQMTLISPSGTLGAGSLAAYGTYDDDTPPPSSSADETVLEFAGAIIRFVAGRIEIPCDLTVTGTVAIDGPVAITGSTLTHNGRNVGDDHRHSDVMPGGGISGVPI